MYEYFLFSYYLSSITFLIRHKHVSRHERCIFVVSLIEIALSYFIFTLPLNVFMPFFELILFNINLILMFTINKNKVNSHVKINSFKKNVRNLFYYFFNS